MFNNLDELMAWLEANGLALCEYRPSTFTRKHGYVDFRNEGYYPVRKNTLNALLGVPPEEEMPEVELQVGMRVVDSEGVEYRVTDIIAGNTVMIKVGRTKKVITQRKTGIWYDHDKYEGVSYQVGD